MIEYLELITEKKLLSWFIYYKTTDGQPKNQVYKNGTYLSRTIAYEIIKECHNAWFNLLAAGDEKNNKKYSLDSIYYTMIMKEQKKNPNKKIFNIFDHMGMYNN